MKITKFSLFGLILTLLSACVSNPDLPKFSGRAAENFAATSSIGSQLSSRDANALAPVFIEAMDTGEAGRRFNWRGPNATGSVVPGPLRVGNLLADPRRLLKFRPGLKLSRLFETEFGEFVLTRNSNVRFGPSADDKVAEVLPSGTGVNVVGKTIDSPWMLIAVDGVITGFVYEELMVRRPGTELELAGGPTRRPHLCRPFDQSLTLNNRTDQWSGVACDKGDGWVLQTPDEKAPTRLF